MREIELSSSGIVFLGSKESDSLCGLLLSCDYSAFLLEKALLRGVDGSLC